MKKIVFFIAVAFGVFMSDLEAKAQFDPENPSFEALSGDELSTWQTKDITGWKSSFGDDVGTWNPLQMEFYKKVRLSALSDAEKDSYKSKSDDDWASEFGGGMDTWQIQDMLFYSAIQELKMN